MRVSAAGNMPLQGLVKPAKPVVMIMVRGNVWGFAPNPTRNLRFLAGCGSESHTVPLCIISK